MKLDDLLSKINKDNIHKEIPVGEIKSENDFPILWRKLSTECKIYFVIVFITVTVLWIKFVIIPLFLKLF